MTTITNLTAAVEGLREIVGRMTPGEWVVWTDHSHFDIASDIRADGRMVAQTVSHYPAIKHDAAGIVALRNTALPIIDAQAAEVAALAAFKAYCHERMDGAGIPTHPDGEHSAAGCRIGDRFDILIGQRDAQAARIAELEAEVVRLRGPVIEYRRGFGPGDGDSAALNGGNHE